MGKVMLGQGKSMVSFCIPTRRSVKHSKNAQVICEFVKANPLTSVLQLDRLHGSGVKKQVIKFSWCSPARPAFQVLGYEEASRSGCAEASPSEALACYAIFCAPFCSRSCRVYALVHSGVSSSRDRFSLPNNERLVRHLIANVFHLQSTSWP